MVLPVFLLTSFLTFKSCMALTNFFLKMLTLKGLY